MVEYETGITPEESETNHKKISKSDIKNEEARLTIIETQLKIEKAKAELEGILSQKELNQAVALKKSLSDLIPVPSAKPPDGTVTAGEKSGYLTDILAYRAMKNVVSAMVEEIGIQPGKKILFVHNPDMLTRDVMYEQISSQLQVLEEAILTQIKTNNSIIENTRILPEIALVSAAAEATITLASYLRSNYSMTSRDMSVSNKALEAMLAGKLTQKKYQVHIENFSLCEDNFWNSSPLGVKISTLKDNVELLKVSADDLGDPADAHLPLNKKNAINDSKIILSRVGTYLQEIRTSNTPEENPILVDVMVQDYIRMMKPDYLLYVEVASSGGDVITKQAFMSFWSYYKYIAGCSASYLLAEMNGKIVSANTISRACSYKTRLDSDSPGTVNQIKM